MRILFFLAVSISIALAIPQPISLHPQNPHYFLWQGKPTILVGSTEHYGGVINLDFDYDTYLRVIAEAGMQMTRVWSGYYRELNMTFGILNNTLAPQPLRYAVPWVRSIECCYFDGGNKFDLDEFEPEYFARLKDFVAVAASYDIIVNFGIFCRFYTDALWGISPVNANNNDNDVENMNYTSVHTLTHKNMLAYQTKLVQKLVTELNEFNNIFYEVINEPNQHDTVAWRDYMIQTIVDTEKSLPKKHLISEVYGPYNKATSIASTHYGKPSDNKANYDLNIALSNGETGFSGSENVAYRTQAYRWFISGGATFDNLDYSFTAEHPDGTACCPVVGPSGGGPELRKQLNIAKNLFMKLDLVNIYPMFNLSIVVDYKPTIAWVGILAHKNNEQFAIYANNTQQITMKLNLPHKSYNLTMYDPITGSVIHTSKVHGGVTNVSSPQFEADIFMLFEEIKKKTTSSTVII